eukprot:363403-Chlamydomonas_euryale.AAC.21
MGAARCDTCIIALGCMTRLELNAYAMCVGHKASPFLCMTVASARAVPFPTFFLSENGIRCANSHQMQHTAHKFTQNMHASAHFEC